MNKSVLIIAAHPDDEILGCGGTAALHARDGDDVHSIIVCEGESLRYGNVPVGQLEQANAAARHLNVKKVHWLGFRDQHLDTHTLIDIVTPLEHVVDEIQPSIVYCQFGGDINRDHQILFQAALVALRPTRAFLRSIYAFDTASSTEWGYPRSFIPDTWIDISETLDQKLEALSCYTSELREYPHPRSTDGLRGRAAGWGTQCCMKSAEVFMTIRSVYRNGNTPV
ncbi:MAG: PIG-L family deacetylase [Deltaproteobacteria bacterium]|jgi:LmbE family N-acetylglucosaminyl deacetylase|nr:PIG-L family deacetylase [Deltaproteobacteria bacterium]